MHDDAGTVPAAVGVHETFQAAAPAGRDQTVVAGMVHASPGLRAALLWWAPSPDRRSLSRRPTLPRRCHGLFRGGGPTGVSRDVMLAAQGGADLGLGCRTQMPATKFGTDLRAGRGGDRMVFSPERGRQLCFRCRTEVPATKPRRYFGAGSRIELSSAQGGTDFAARGS